MPFRWSPGKNELLWTERGVGLSTFSPRSKRAISRRSPARRSSRGFALLREGIPYQTLIASVLHEYVMGRLVDRG